MKRKTKQFDKTGRDPGMGMVDFKTGVTLSRRNRLGNRNTKFARRELRDQINGD